jgi:predicted dehydrogenase
VEIRVTLANGDVASGTPRVSVIGIGANGVEQAGRVLAHPGQWELVSIIDTSVAAFQRFQSLHHKSAVRFYRYLDQAIARSEPDVVVISTLAASHIAICNNLIDMGFEGSILVEKPLSNTLVDALELKERITSSRWPGNIFLDFKRRVGAPYLLAHEFATKTTLGSMLNINASWRAKISMTGSHYVDLAMHISGGQPVRVRAKLEAVESPDFRGYGFYDPSGNCVVEFDNGITLHMDFTGSSESQLGGVRFEYEEGSIFVDREETYYEVLDRDGNSTRYEMDDFDSRYGWFESTLSKITDGGDPSPVCSLDDGITDLAILVGAFVSHSRNGEWVSLPLNDVDSRHVLKLA